MKHYLSLLSLATAFLSAPASANAPDIRIAYFTQAGGCGQDGDPCLPYETFPVIEISGTNIDSVRFCENHRDITEYYTNTPVLAYQLGWRKEGSQIVRDLGRDQLQRYGKYSATVNNDLKAGSCVELLDANGNSLLRKTL